MGITRITICTPIRRRRFTFFVFYLKISLRGLWLPRRCSVCRHRPVYGFTRNRFIFRVMCVLINEVHFFTACTRFFVPTDLLLRRPWHNFNVYMKTQKISHNNDTVIFVIHFLKRVKDTGLYDLFVQIFVKTLIAT